MIVKFKDSLDEASYEMFQITDWDSIAETLAHYLKKRTKKQVEVDKMKGKVDIQIGGRFIGSIATNKEHQTFVSYLADTNKGAKGFGDLIRAADYLMKLAGE